MATPKATPVTRYCEVCREVLTAGRPHARYCSDRCRQTAHRQNVRLQNRRSEAGGVGDENANPQVSDLQSVTPSGSAHPDTPGPVVTVPATRCGCPDCRERVEEPEGYWDRVTDRIIAAEQARAPIPDYEPRFPNWREWLPKGKRGDA